MKTSQNTPALSALLLVLALGAAAVFLSSEVPYISIDSTDGVLAMARQAWQGITHQPQHSSPPPLDSPNDRKRFNYAHSNSGAKISEKAPGMLQTKALLTDDPDTYMMTANSETERYFVVSLSQDIQIEAVQLLSLERYASRIRQFQLFGSNQESFDTWNALGKFEAQHHEQWQNFAISKKKWVRHLKFVILNVYDPHEYYCVLTQIKVLGSSLLQGITQDLSILSAPKTPEPPIQEETDQPRGTCQNQFNWKPEEEKLESSGLPQLFGGKKVSEFMQKFQDLKMKVMSQRNSVKTLGDDDEEEESSVFRQLAQHLDDLKLQNLLLEKYLLVDFAEGLQNELKGVKLAEKEILEAIQESNEDELNLVTQRVQREGQRVQVQLQLEKEQIQEQLYMFEVIIMLLLLVVVCLVGRSL